VQAAFMVEDFVPIIKDAAHSFCYGCDDGEGEYLNSVPQKVDSLCDWIDRTFSGIVEEYHRKLLREGADQATINRFASTVRAHDVRIKRFFMMNEREYDAFFSFTRISGLLKRGLA
jgi:hypothetical protein